MEAPREHPAEEIKRLQRCLNDLVSILALPAVWTGGEPSRLVSTLLDALHGMLRLDLIYVRLNDSFGEPPVEIVRGVKEGPQEIGELLNRWLGVDPQKWPPQARKHIGDKDISLASLQMGLQGEIGVIVAGTYRTDFPSQTERLVLSVAANQAAIGLQEARLLHEQKRVASELDRRVAQRTKELAEAERNLRQIVDSIPGFVCALSPNGEIELVNRRLLDYYGRTIEEMKGWATNDSIHPDDRSRSVAIFTNSIKTGTPHELEQRCRRADGVYRWFQISGLPVRGVDGRITGWYVLMTDIDDRKRAEDELRRSEAFLAQGQRLNLTGSFSWRLDTDEIRFSEQLYRIFEFEIDSPVTLERIGSRIHPEDIPLLTEKMDLARTDVNDHDYGLRLRMPNGSIKHLRTKSYGVRDRDGRLEHVGAIQDVTEQRLSEEALGKVRSELAHMTRVASLGALTASIAHEVNQPLSGIVTNASTCLRMLAADPPNVDGALETARRTIRDGKRAADVISRLRALFGKTETTIEPVDLNEAAREVIALLLSDLQRDRVILRQEFADDLSPVSGDRVQLQQVILNLLRNASDAMSGVDDRPRHLTVRTEDDDGDRVRLTVQDAGVGIDPQSLDRLFDAFYTTKNAGMGVGLSVSRTIIENHHGRLWAAPNDGPGATFSFSIPYKPEGVPDSQNPGLIRASVEADAAKFMRTS
jgi:PAS domain S-box-containing protein